MGINVLSGFGFLDLSTPDLVIILVILLLLFGSKKLPELSRSLGQSAREVRKGFSDDHSAKETKQTEAENNS